MKKNELHELNGIITAARGPLVERSERDADAPGSAKGLQIGSQATFVLGMLTPEEQAAYKAIVKKGMKGAGKEAEDTFMKGVQRASLKADADPEQMQAFIRKMLKESYLGEDPFGVLTEER